MDPLHGKLLPLIKARIANSSPVADYLKVKIDRNKVL